MHRETRVGPTVSSRFIHLRESCKDTDVMWHQLYLPPYWQHCFHWRPVENKGRRRMSETEKQERVCMCVCVSTTHREDSMERSISEWGRGHLQSRGRCRSQTQSWGNNSRTPGCCSKGAVQHVHLCPVHQEGETKPWQTVRQFRAEDAAWFRKCPRIHHGGVSLIWLPKESEPIKSFLHSVSTAIPWRAIPWRAARSLAVGGSGLLSEVQIPPLPTDALSNTQQRITTLIHTSS